MKKTLLTIMTTFMTTVCVMAIGCGIYVAGVKSNYETKLEEAICEHETELDFVQGVRLDLMTECNELTNRVSELETQVYNIMEGNDYDVDINYDGVKHTYKSEKEDNGFISNVVHIIDEKIK